MQLEQAVAVLRTILEPAPGPVSVDVADDHGELVAAETIDGAPDTRLIARRQAYAAASSAAAPTAVLAGKVRNDPAELASFDPLFTFFRGGVAVLTGESRIAAVGLTGEQDEELARMALVEAGLRSAGSS